MSIFAARRGIIASAYRPPPLLDRFPGAKRAYSLRRLRRAYAGPAIRVRRSSDNAEMDIGFAGDDLDTAALLAFVGEGDGYVVTRYDQSGNGGDATQGTAARQPLIVESGALVTRNGRPAMRMNNSALHDPTASWGGTAGFLACAVAADANTPSNSARLVYAGTNDTSHGITSLQNNMRAAVTLASFTAAGAPRDDVYRVFACWWDGENVRLLYNGSTVATASASGTLASRTGYTEGAQNASANVPFDGWLSESVVWDENIPDAAAVCAAQAAYWAS